MTTPDLSAVAAYVRVVGDDTADMLERGTLDPDRARADIAGAVAEAATRLAAQYQRDGDSAAHQARRSHDRGKAAAGDKHGARAETYYVVARDLTNLAQLLRTKTEQG